MDNIKIINFNENVELPTFEVRREGDYVRFGSDNLYPNYLIDVYHKRSNKHKAIINRKVDMIAGNGFASTTGDAKLFIDNFWGEHSLEEILVDVALDFELFDGFALKVRWNKLGTKISAIDYIPFSDCRISADGESVFVSEDWANIRKKSNRPAIYPIFNPAKAKNETTQIYYYYTKSVGIKHYPLPNYSSTLNWIELDYEISNFHLNSARNGFMPSFILNFATGIPTAEEMEDAHKTFKRKYSGTSNAGKFILTFSEGQDQKPTLEPINLSDSDERFILLHKEMRDEIFIGHNVTNPQLFGIRVAGELGGKDQLLESLAIFQSTYINKRQKTIAKQFNKLAKWAGVTVPLELNTYSIDFNKIENE